MADLRVACEDDLDEMEGLHAQCFGARKWSRAQIAGSLVLPTTTAVAAFVQGIMGGFVLVQKAEKEAEILTLCVAPCFQRRGIATALLREAKQGARAVYLDVASDNLPARRLYEKCGFSVVGLRKGYYEQGADSTDAILYRQEG